MARLSEAERERIKLHHKVAPGLPKNLKHKSLAGQREFDYEAISAAARKAAEVDNGNDSTPKAVEGR